MSQKTGKVLVILEDNAFNITYPIIHAGDYMGGAGPYGR